MDKFADISKLLDIYNDKSFEGGIEFACKKFNKYFNNKIRALLHHFPEDMCHEDGTYFWEKKKRYPKIIELDVSDQLHVDFITSFSNILAFNLGIPENRDQDFIKEVAAEVEFETFNYEKPKEGEELQKLERLVAVSYTHLPKTPKPQNPVSVEGDRNYLLSWRIKIYL